MAALKLNRAGIDVSSQELVVKLEKKGVSQTEVSIFENNKAGHKKLIKYLTKGGSKAQVCLEATGVYHFELALCLFKSSAIDVMVVNPKVIKHFAIASMQRAKTDRVDAEIILEYLKRMEFIDWRAPEEEHLQLQALSRRMYQLKQEIVRETGRRHAGDYSNVLENTVNNDIEVNIRHIKGRIALLQSKALEVIQSNDILQKKFNLLISIKGIAKTSAIQILSELVCLPADMAAEQWVAFTGLDPRAVESGSSISKPRRISKAGNKYLRTALYMPAWVAVQTEASVKAFYDKLLTAGKKPMQAIVAVMRKLLHAIWGILHSNKPWDGQKFFAVTADQRAVVKA